MKWGRQKTTIDSYERHLHLECRGLACSGVKGKRGILADRSRLKCCGWVESLTLKVAAKSSVR